MTLTPPSERKKSCEPGFSLPTTPISKGQVEKVFVTWFDFWKLIFRFRCAQDCVRGQGRSGGTQVTG